jgi:hypothetical protein
MNRTFCNLVHCCIKGWCLDDTDLHCKHPNYPKAKIECIYFGGEGKKAITDPLQVIAALIKHKRCVQYGKE